MAVSLAKLAEIVRDELRNADIELTPNTRFEDLPGRDSMHLIAVVVEVETWFGLMFEPVEIEAVHTADDLLRMIACKQAAEAA